MPWVKLFLEGNYNISLPRPSCPVYFLLHKMTSRNDLIPHLYPAPFRQSALDMSWIKYIWFITVSSSIPLDDAILPSWYYLR